MAREQAVKKVFEKYPARVFKNRKEHLIIKEGTEEPQVIQANTRTIPGIITNRGCCYAGCKGVVLGPLKDVVHIVHGPIGCSYYAWGTRRNKARDKEGEQNFLPYCFSTDMQESDIVFGGEKKLRQAIKEVMEIFKPSAITISATCPVGLIGDDINAIASEAQQEYGITVMAFSCEGYKGVSQSAGHHIANNGLMKNVIGTGTDSIEGKYSINILGEYNIGGDGWEIARVLEKIGYKIVSIMTGDGSLSELRNAHKADLNLVQCHRSINYIAEMIEKKYGTHWLKVNFIGLTSSIESLRNMAKYFGDEALIAKTEEVIAEEMQAINAEIDYFKSRLEGRTAFLFVGGSRAHHYQVLLEDLGIESIMAGYEFAHRDDYEGREVIPDIKLDADSKNIEDLKIERDERQYRVTMPPEKYEEMKKVIPLGYYKGMIREMKDGSIIVDDLNHHETEEFIRLMKPDMFFSGIKDKFAIQKMGVYSKQLHSYDYSGPYAMFKGALRFAKDLNMGMYTPAWKFVVAPWKTEPALSGTFVGGEA